MITPYYDDGNGIQIYLGDCRLILPQLDVKVGLVLTDPPYSDYYTEEYGYDAVLLDVLDTYNCPQFVFWSARATFPLSHTAIHIWDKQTGIGTGYERIFERNGGKAFSVFNHYRHNNPLSASWCGDPHYDHPSQKPIRLIMELAQLHTGDLILDPFLGSGTTAVAAKILGRKCIGIEIEEKYCEIAVKRLAQSVMRLDC